MSKIAYQWSIVSIGNYVKINDTLSDTIYYLPKNTIVLTKLDEFNVQFNALGENIVLKINSTDVISPVGSTSADTLMTLLAPIIYQSVGGGGGGVGTASYLLASPTNVTVGNLPAGTNLTGRDWDDIFEQMLIAYLNPAFTSFTSALFGTYEVGQPLSVGPTTINYSVSNSVNIKIQPPNVGVPSSSIPGSSFSVNPFVLASSGSYTITIPAATTINSPGSYNVLVQGTNTNSVNFSTSNNVLFRQRIFYGQSSLTSLTDTDILALASNQLQLNFAGTYSFPAGGYKYFCYPASMGTATVFTNTSNGFPVAMFGTVPIVSITNAYGIVQNYRVHRTLNILGSTINIAIS